MASVNKVIIVGNIGKDPETRYLPSGDAVTNITVATSDKYKDKATNEMKEITEWHRITFFGKLAEIASQYLKRICSLCRRKICALENGRIMRVLKNTPRILLLIQCKCLRGALQRVDQALMDQAHRVQPLVLASHRMSQVEVWAELDDDIPFKSN
jgi:hypothetical protein